MLQSLNPANETALSMSEFLGFVFLVLNSLLFIYKDLEPSKIIVF